MFIIYILSNVKTIIYGIEMKLWILVFKNQKDNHKPEGCDLFYMRLKLNSIRKGSTY